MPEAPAPNFVMHGARGAIASGLGHISAQVEALERAVNENPSLAFDLARTVIESACRTILTERGIAFASTDELPKLFKAASNSLPFLPASEKGNIDARKSLAQTLSGLSTAVQGVCELRNACGFASHGSDGPRPRLESVQALLAAEAADTIVGFFHRVHQQDRSAPSPNNLTLENDAGFDAFIDEQFSAVSIFQEDFLASRVLFELAPEPYRLYLSEYKQDKKTSEDEEQKEQSPDEVLAAAERIMALNEVEP
ncbi:abortive infection family protein [Acidipila rosea]|uniref:Abortive infection Abi-like protein n=1 Tax=Acidipila rosea TaxID=768535 RepID=A0A4V2PVV5_9BACT|nr:abortive infection family protein [Acidipila rosea]TCK75871.1 abortive infection Abi-like protein [Acidipila rosea]